MQIFNIVSKNVLFRKGVWHKIDTLLSISYATFDIVSTYLRLREGIRKEIITFNGPGPYCGGRPKHVFRKISLISET